MYKHIPRLPSFYSSIFLHQDIVYYSECKAKNKRRDLGDDHSLDGIYTFISHNDLKFNPLKSKAMVFSRKRHPVQAPSYFSLNGFTLEIVDSVVAGQHHLF